MFLPGLHISKNTVSNLYRTIGENVKGRRSFYRVRMARVAADHHIIIDGMQKKDNSEVKPKRPRGRPKKDQPST